MLICFLKIQKIDKIIFCKKSKKYLKRKKIIKLKNSNIFILLVLSIKFYPKSNK